MAQHEVLRAGRGAVERWAYADGTLLTQVATCPLDPARAGQPGSLAEAITRLYAGTTGAQVTLVLESAWVPVMLVDTGPALLSAAEVDALVRHRFGLYYTDGFEPVADWELRIEHRAGTRRALAYGLQPALKQALLGLAVPLQIRWQALSPALAWGIDRLRPQRAWPAGRGSLVWPEQDRSLIAHWGPQGLVGLHPGAPRLPDDEAIDQAMAAERARLGMADEAAPVTAATWGNLPPTGQRGGRCNWVPLGRRAGPPVGAEVAEGSETADLARQAKA